MIKQKSKLRQRLCRHNLVVATRREMFTSLNGNRVYLVCEKCGRIMDSFLERGRLQYDHEIQPVEYDTLEYHVALLHDAVRQLKIDLLAELAKALKHV